MCKAHKLCDINDTIVAFKKIIDMEKKGFYLTNGLLNSY